MKKLLPLILVLSIALSACNSWTFTTTFQWPVVFSSGNPNDQPTTSPSDAAPVDTSNVATLSNACVIAGGHQGWDNGPKDFEWAAVLNRAELEQGLSMEPKIEQAFGTTQVQIAGQTPPMDFEVLNDGLQILVCFSADSQPEIFILDRTSDNKLPFWAVSYIILSDQSLQTWHDDTENNGWKGLPGGSTERYEVSASYTSWENALNAYPDLAGHVANLKSLADAIKNGDIGLPEYGIVKLTWQK